jgi:hypothetical protein
MNNRNDIVADTNNINTKDADNNDGDVHHADADFDAGSRTDDVVDNDNNVGGASDGAKDKWNTTRRGRG